MIAPGVLVTVSVLPWVAKLALPLTTIGATGLDMAEGANASAPNPKQAATARESGRTWGKTGRKDVIWGKAFRFYENTHRNLLVVPDLDSPLTYAYRINRHP
jgi:hypothetical protein